MKLLTPTSPRTPDSQVFGNGNSTFLTPLTLPKIVTLTLTQLFENLKVKLQPSMPMEFLALANFAQKGQICSFNSNSNSNFFLSWSWCLACQ